MVKEALAAANSVSALVSQVWHYFTGDQTRDQRSLEAAGQVALTDAKNAQSAAELNAADAELQRVHDQALARKREP